MTLHEIENAIAGLPAGELATFRAWFQEFDAEVWDRQLEEDVKAGRLDGLAAEAMEDYRQGRTTEL